MLKRLFAFAGVMCWVLPLLGIGGVQFNQSVLFLGGAVLLGAAGVLHAIEKKGGAKDD